MVALDKPYRTFSNGITGSKSGKPCLGSGKRSDDSCPDWERRLKNLPTSLDPSGPAGDWQDRRELGCPRDQLHGDRHCCRGNDLRLSSDI